MWGWGWGGKEEYLLPLNGDNEPVCSIAQFEQLFSIGGKIRLGTFLIQCCMY